MDHIGPVEYMVLAFPENRFSGRIADELRALADGGTIGLLDLVFVSKGPRGELVTLEVDESEELKPFSQLSGEIGELIGWGDIEHAAADLPPGSSAALLVWEDRWAAPLVAALRDAGAILVEGARIPDDLLADALASREAATGVTASH
jgi:hypothetical protein